MTNPTSKTESNSDIAAEISRKVFEALGNPEILPLTESILTATLTSAFDNYRVYLQESSGDETTARIPVENPQLQAHVTAVAAFMEELAPYLSLDDGLVSTRDFIDAARRIREWCHDHQTFPKLEYSEHCGCCARNKITVEVFARPAVEPSPERRCVCGLATIPEGELRVEVGPTTHRLAGPCFQTSSVNGKPEHE